VDIVTTRSVLIFVQEKERALSEFFRVLRPEGRLSIFEPINRLNRFRRTYDAGKFADLDARVQRVFEELQPLASDPMFNFDDRDLVMLAEDAGFADVRLTLEVRVFTPEPQSWESWANVAWNPKLPTLSEAVAASLSPAEAELYVRHMRTAVEQGVGRRRMARAWLVGTKSAHHRTTVVRDDYPQAR
jgi:hypothetical protein